MAGKGRGVLLNDLVKEGKISNQTSSASSNQTEQVEEAENVTLNQKHSTVALFGKGLATNPSPSLGRGLMKPMQFMNASPSNKQKTQALISAEEYLKATVFRSVNNEMGQSSSDLPEQKEMSHSRKSNIALAKQPSSPTSKEKAEADAEWQRYKFQRQILGILSTASSENFDDSLAALKCKITECPLSAKYPQFNETDLVLESLVDKSAQMESFIEISIKLMKKVAEHDMMQFEVLFPPLISRKISEYIHVTASNKVLSPRAKCFCQLLGSICISSFETNNDSRLSNLVSLCLQDCMEQWTYPDGIGSEVEGFNINKAETHAHAVTELFKAMELQNQEKDRIHHIMENLERNIILIKESVLNDFLPRKIREVYLDVLLNCIPKWHFSTSRNDVAETIHGESVSKLNQSSKSKETLGSGTKPNDSSLSSPLPTPASEMQLPAEQVAMTSTFANEVCASSEYNGNWIKTESEGDLDGTGCSVDLELKTTEQTPAGRGPFAGDYTDDVEKDTIVVETEDPVTVASDEDNVIDVNKERGPFENINKMLIELRLEDQLHRFQDNVIRDTVLEADRSVLKEMLKEASFPPGVIYEIVLYLDKNDTKSPGRRFKGDVSGRNPLAGPYTDSQTRPYYTASNSRQQKGHAGYVKPPKKRLLGIGRGSTNSDKYKQGIKPRVAPWRVDKDASIEGKNQVKDVNDWRVRGPAGRGQSLFMDSERDHISAVGSHRLGINYSHQSKSELGEIRQVGKVEPLQRTSIDDMQGMGSEKLPSPVKFQGFGVPPRM